jgi:quercetin 2,3-dioxygenase
MASGGTRPVLTTARGRPTSDGAGVKLTRVIGTPEIPALDPFLMLDEFGSDDPRAYIAGFPDHPHRGFETVTYMLAGRMRHRDNHGHEGLLEPGSVQWMTAGRGIVHSEMPEQERGLMRGFQLWVNLPARDKMTAPRYQEFAPAAIPTAALARGVEARVIAGEAGSVRGPVAGIAVDPLYLDLRLEVGAEARLPVKRGHGAFLYVFEGSVVLGERELGRGEVAILGDGDALALGAGGVGAAALLVAGRPIGEPVARYGPFVMNTQAEIHQAISDFQAGRF